MIIDRSKICSLLLGFALIAGACGQPPNKTAGESQTQTQASSQACEPDSTWPAAPTVEQLTSTMYHALDPNVPLAEKVPYVQGAESDPELLNRLAEKGKESHFAAKILSVADNCNGTASAAALVTINGKTNAVQVPLVTERDKWKLNKEWMCGLMNDYQLSSAICS